MQRVDVGRLPRQACNVNDGDNVADYEFGVHGDSADLNNAASAKAEIEQVGAEETTELEGPTKAGEVEGERVLLLAKEGLIEKAGKGGEDATVGDEEVVRSAEAMTRLEGHEVEAEGGERDGVGEREGEGGGGLRRVGDKKAENEEEGLKGKRRYE